MMSGWAVVGIGVAVAALLFALAWWHSGRQGPLRRREMSETEKDYLRRNANPLGRSSWR